MKIIPAIDVIEGKCVRLSQGDYSRKKVYNEDPLEVAKAFEGAGLGRLHLVDLDGARAKHIVNWKVLEKIANQTELHIDFGGGLKSDNDLRIAFECGAQQVTGGTIAVKQPEVFLNWLEKYGAEQIILGADVKEGKIAVSGWEEKSDLELIFYLNKYFAKGIRYAISTEVSKDGELSGSALDMYREIREQIPDLNIIASGGVTNLAELDQLREMGCYGAIIGKAIYEGHLKLNELYQFESTV